MSRKHIKRSPPAPRVCPSMLRSVTMLCLSQQRKKHPRVFAHYVLGRLVALFFFCHPGTLATCDGQAYLLNRYPNRDLVTTEGQLVSVVVLGRVQIFAYCAGLAINRHRGILFQPNLVCRLCNRAYSYNGLKKCICVTFCSFVEYEQGIHTIFNRQPFFPLRHTCPTFKLR